MNRLLFILLWLVGIGCGALAQTSTGPNEGSWLSRNPATGIYTIFWWGSTGNTYFIQHSEDLINWIYFPEIKTGANAILGENFQTNADRFFVRLRSSNIPTTDPYNADFDGDGVGNYAELLQGSDPLFAPDTDDDGMPDWWELAHGLDPADPLDAFSDPDHDGVVNFQEFTNGTDPHVLDSNGDPNDGNGPGEPGGGSPSSPPDDYPDDPVRKVAFGLRHYGVIDLSLITAAAMSDLPDLMAVGDAHQVSILTHTDDGTGRTFTVTQWDLDKEKKRKSTMTDNRNEMSTSSKKVRSYYPSDLNASGTLVGSYSEHTTSLVWDRGFYLPLDKSKPSDYIKDGDGNGGRCYLEKISVGGLFYGGGTVKKTNPNEHLVSYPLVRSEWKQQDEGNFYFTAINSKGDALGAPTWLTPPPYYYVWGAAGMNSLRDDGVPYDLNKNLEAVGIAYTFDAEGYPLGMHWSNKAGSITGSNLEIPTIVDTQKQIRSASPFLINDFGRIILGAEFKLGDGNGTWKSGTGFLATTDLHASNAQDIAWVEFGVGKTFDIRGQNQKGTLCGIYNGHAALAIPVEFQPVTEDALNRGFDYPILDDHNQGEQADQDKPEWWTSVGRTDVENQHLNYNEDVKVVFASKAAAQLCEIFVPADSTDLISVTPSGGLTNAETTLKITGKDPAGKPGIKQATIQVRTKDSSHQVLQTLNVQVMPTYKVRLAISFVEDSNSVAGNGSPGTQIAANYKTPQTRQGIVDQLNEIYRQARLYFVDVTPAGKMNLNIFYDSSQSITFQGGLNGLVDRPFPAMVGEFELIESGVESNTIHIFIARQLNYGNILGETTGTHAIVGADNCGSVDILKRVCAHEAGHALGLSKKDTDGHGHDNTGQPRRYDSFSLMYESISSGFDDRWIRHEDWIQANDEFVRKHPAFQVP